MFGIQDLALFIVSGLLLNMAPGPDSLLIMTRSAIQGWRAGVIAALGISSGTIIHIIAAALGLSALLATSAAAFMVVKLAGAAYLLYIGINFLFKKQTENKTPTPEQKQTLAYRKIFLQGFFTNILNPKVALFFLAFVPQFIAPNAPDKTLVFVLLGIIFNINGMLWCAFLALSTTFVSHKTQISTKVSLWLNRLIGGVFVSLGIKLALTKQN